ncbi:hypothetical protein FRC03_008715 [Tulasnella sp. 419]|nr:hypothetical protein FRC03_008715 [Tulasnella sp. 419]
MLSFNKLNIIPLLTLYPLLTVATGCPYKEGDEPTIELNKPLDLNGDLYSSVTLKWVDEGNNSCVYSTFLGDNKVAVKTPKGTPSEAAAIAKGDNWKKEVEALTRLSTLLGLGYGQDGRPWLFEAFYGGINLYRSSIYKKYVVPIYHRLNPNPTPHQQRICQRFLTDVRVAIAHSFMECIHVGLGHKDIHLASTSLQPCQLLRDELLYCY